MSIPEAIKLLQFLKDTYGMLGLLDRWLYYDGRDWIVREKNHRGKIKILYTGESLSDALDMLKDEKKGG